MRQFYRQPIFYCIAAPLVAALWPVFVWGWYLPDARKNCQADITNYTRSQEAIEELLSLDAGRLDYANVKGAAVEFDYATAVQGAADFCKIPASSCVISSGIIVTTSGQKSQGANVILKEIDIARFARFLSTIQLRWTNLQCTKVTLRNRKGLPDSWDIAITFKYYY